MKKKILVVLPVNEAHKAALAESLRDGGSGYELVYTGGAEPTAASSPTTAFSPMMA